MPDKFEMWNTSKPDPLVVRAARLCKSGRALDLGAGTGRDALYLAKNDFQVTAVDISEASLQVLGRMSTEEGYAIETVNQEIETFKSNKAYDIIVCDMVLHFLPDSGAVSSVIANMQSMTATGGINVITAYTNQNASNKRPYLFKEKELANCYGEWEIEYYEEKPTPWFQLDDEPEPRRNHAVYLLARKNA